MSTQEGSTDNEKVNNNITDKMSWFSTKDYYLTANSFVQVLTTSAENIESLNQEIDECFKRMEAEGYDNPILIGAIPFDTTRKSMLNLYSCYEKSNKKTPLLNSYKNDTQMTNKESLVAKEKFINIVNYALDAFQRTDLKKIVLSQAVDFGFDGIQNPVFYLQELLDQNPKAYNFIIPVEDHKYLLGASPELLSSKQNSNFISNPLAGSRPKLNDLILDQKNVKQLQQSIKEQNEHRIVVENILSNIALYCVELSVSEFPDILETSTMYHLSSTLQGILRRQAPNALNLALKLHPTPAVCGMPTRLAKEFILKNEGYDRGYYTGLVGWMDAEGNGEWVVTIRCGLLDNTKLRLYAGAGIVEGSDPESEWFETEAKMKTILNLCNSSI